MQTAIATEQPTAELSSSSFLQHVGLWAMEERYLNGYWQFARKVTFSVDSPPAESREQRSTAGRVMVNAPTLTIKDGIAIIGLAGMLTKTDSFWWATTSTVLARSKIRAAISNSDVLGILLVVESPGGTVAGTTELADEVAAAAKLKPVWTFCEDLACSAAYWVGCQAEKVFANQLASIGSIGTYVAITDSSKAAEKAGIKVHVIKAGKFKGAGVPGTPITDEQLEQWQIQVNGLNEHFVADVARGRKISIDQARNLADGRVFISAAAKARGLIDGVQSLDKTFVEFVAHARSKNKT